MALSAQDHEDIRQLLARYNQGGDLGEFDAFVSTFTHDGAFEVVGLPAKIPLSGRHEGHDELRVVAARHYENCEGRARHCNWNVLIEGDGDEATMISYLAGFGAGQGSSAGLQATGIYRDKLRRTPDGWRFAERIFTLDPE